MQDSTVRITVTAVDGATKTFEGIGDAAVKQANRAANAWIKANDVANVSIQSSGESAAATNRAAKAQDNLAASTRRSYFAQTALTTVLSAGINKAFLEMVDVTGQAIQRVDLLANFPKSMAALGLSASDASDSLKTLTGYISQIGGNLQDATTSVTRFSEVTKNVKAATAEFIGVNNALIAGGASQQVQANALEQLTQAYSRGIPQLIEWKSLMVAMPAQLNLVAKAMGQPNAQALGEQLTNGKISIQDFLTELTKLSTGTGPIVAQAYARMNGIQFAFTVFKNTLVAGMTSIIQTVGRQNIIDFFSVLTGVVQQLATWAVRLIGILFSLFNIVSRVFGGPQLKLANDSTAGIADNLATGADSASDLANNLDDAGAAAKKTAGQLASFDKMNVLSSDTGSGSSKAATPSVGNGLDPSTASELNGIFDGIQSKVNGITSAAKILAAIIASIAGIKFAQGLLNQFNGLVQSIEDAGKNIDKLKGKLVGTEKDKGIFNKAKEGAQGLLSSLGNIAGAIALTFSNSKVGSAASKFGKALFAPLVAGAALAEGAIDTLILTITEGLAVSIGAAVGIIVVAVAVIVGVIILIAKNWDTIMNALKVAASATWNFLSSGFKAIVDAISTAWNFLYDVFSGPIKFLLEFWQAVITLVIAITAIFIQSVVGLFVALVQGIYDTLKFVSGWIYDNVITPILDFFTKLWSDIVYATTTFFSGVTAILKPIGSWIYTNVITPVVGFFKGLWDTVSGFVSGFFINVTNILAPFTSWIYNHLIVPVGNLFSGLWDGIKNGLANMINGLAGLFGNIGDIVKVPLNGIIDIINNFLAKFVSIKVPDWVPSFGGKKVEFPKIPKLAKGGIVDQATLAQVGEQGSEAIVPLENNTEWIDKLAAKINSATGTNGMPFQLTVQIGEDKIVSKVIDLINEKTQMSGRNTIFV